MKYLNGQKNDKCPLMLRKCKVMHIRRSNENHRYTMNNKVLQSATKENDI